MAFCRLPGGFARAAVNCPLPNVPVLITLRRDVSPLPAPCSPLPAFPQVGARAFLLITAYPSRGSEKNGKAEPTVTNGLLWLLLF